MKQFCEYNELLTPAEMTLADKMSIKDIGNSFQLMKNAGQAVAHALLDNFPNIKKIAVLCGPGNNGGDGYVVAEILRKKGYHVICYSFGEIKKNTDADKARKHWSGEIKNLDLFQITHYELIVDALFGAGLDRSLSPSLITLINDINQSSKPVIAIDLPSGVSGLTGAVLGAAFQATLTITFFRYKPGHWLYPGRQLCGKHILADIGIQSKILNEINPLTSLNCPALWQKQWPSMTVDLHKYSRGHVAVFSGPSIMTGASRLSAHAAQRIGAGAVTLLTAKEAQLVNAAHLTSIMLHQIEESSQVISFINERKVKIAVLGPGFGDLQKAIHYAEALMSHTKIKGLVLDADALSAFQDRVDDLIKLMHQTSTSVVITPHEGEFQRLFPQLYENNELTRIQKAKSAAKLLNGIVVYKGADTVIASPDGRTTININGTPLLATAGSGDVLSGFIAGLMAQNMPAYESACAAVWLHAACAHEFGLGLIAEDLPDILPSVLSTLHKQE